MSTKMITPEQTGVFNTQIRRDELSETHVILSLEEWEEGIDCYKKPYAYWRQVGITIYIEKGGFGNSAGVTAKLNCSSHGEHTPTEMQLYAARYNLAVLYLMLEKEKMEQLPD